MQNSRSTKSNIDIILIIIQTEKHVHVQQNKQQSICAK